MDAFNDVREFGDRPSSFLTLYPGFQSYRASSAKRGLIRFVETRKAWVVGNEPLAPFHQKAHIFEEFTIRARSAGKSTLMTPVTEKLSRELVKRGFFRLPIGAEPVFDLEKYFEKDPLDRFPHARSLARKGAVVREISFEDTDPELRRKLDSLLEQWRKSLKTVPLSFLNQVDPWNLAQHKKIFVLEWGERVLAFLSAVPIYPRQGCFFADYIRAPRSKAGSVELLFIEAMRALKAQGYREVSLGLCPFAKLEDAIVDRPEDERKLKAMRVAFKRIQFPLGFESIYEFKEKFQPTRWERLYLVSQSQIGARTLVEIARAHFPEGISKAILVSGLKFVYERRNPQAKTRKAPESIAAALRRVPVTMSLAALFLVLHLLRFTVPAVNELYKNNGFSVGAFHWKGWLLGPLFHNTHYHFLGDVMTFLFFGGALELALGSGFAALIAALGLWASNPSAWFVLHSFLRPVSPEQYLRVLQETDFGSSNAVYAQVGALAPLLKNPRWLLVPFALNGFFLCLSMQSWLSLHHVIALYTGVAATAVFQLLKQGPRA